MITPRHPRRRAAIRRVLLLIAVALIAVCRPTGGQARELDTARKVILIDNSERQHGKTPLAPLWTGQLGQIFTTHEYHTTARLPGQNQDFRLAAETLTGNDLVILTGFSGSASVGDQSGNREVSYDYSADELLALERYVRAGGNLLVIPWPMGRPNNLNALLARFGLDLRGDEAHYLEAPTASGQPVMKATRPVAASLAGRTYALRASQWFYPLHALPAEATEIATDNGKPLIVEARSGTGHVVYLGLPNLSNGMGSDQTAFAADNPAFFLDLVAFASGSPQMTADESLRATWDLRIAALQRTLFNGSATRPTQAEWAARLQQLAANGQRCDLGPGCVRWTPTAEQQAFLAQRRAAQDAMMATFAQLDLGVQQGLWGSAPGRERLERDYDGLLTALATEQGQQQAFAELYRRQGGGYPLYPEDNPLFALAALGEPLFFPAAIFILVFGMLTVVRRRKRARAAK